ncbi:MAG: hypothetical protein L0H93_20490 [Nocardioides sp.]|nr:hypothetical protein [Nocardioides sp.]
MPVILGGLAFLGLVLVLVAGLRGVGFALLAMVFAFFLLGSLAKCDAQKDLDSAPHAWVTAAVGAPALVG